MNWKDEHVLILGAARQGTALARYLAEQGASVCISDLRNAEALSAEIEALADLKVDWHLGEHPLSLLDEKSLVCPSGGVPLDIPILKEALSRGIPFSNDSLIFQKAVNCQLIGITGSAGKSTTTSLLGLMAEAAVSMGVYRQAFVGGNLGYPLITELEKVQAEDIAIMELSSFQLELFDQSPPIAALLNLTPNHLDRHKSFEAYAEAKYRILRYQNRNDIAILGRDDAIAWDARRLVKGELISFGLNPPPEGLRGTALENGMITLYTPTEKIHLMEATKVQLRGTHNLQNVLAACALGLAAEIPAAAMQQAISDFRGIPHRIAFVRSWGGADWYNDSIATAPERTMASLRSFEEPIVLLAGGRDKNLPWEAFAAYANQRVRHFILFGEAADKIAKALKAQPGTKPMQICDSLEDAVIAASKAVKPGDVVLLSPGGTSYDAYVDFEARGNQFIELVNAL